MKCPDFEQLVDYLDGKLTPAGAEQFAAHLAAGCADCAENRAWYERVRATAAGDETVAPPAWVFKRAVRIFDTAQRAPRLAERIGQTIARLVFDSFARPQLVGVRSTETANRQLLYRAGDYSIDLQVAPAGAHGDLIGQVLREGETTFESVAGLPLEIKRGDQGLYSAVTNAMGEFKIYGVEYGDYDLNIEMADGQITIPQLPITQS